MRRSAGPLLLLVACACLFAPTSAAAKFKASGWIPYWAQDEASKQISDEKDLFGSASPFWYSTDDRGRIHSAPGAGSNVVSSRLQSAGLASIPTITAPISPDAAIDLLGSRNSRTRHVRRVVDLAKGFDGIDFNYEHPALTTSEEKAKRVRKALNQFFDQACNALARNNRLCVVTVMPRTKPSPEVWRGKLLPWVYDYREIGKVADRVRVMAYDQHAGPYGPGPIAGYRWTKSVARYSAKSMPRRKVELGIPLYGREWTRSRRAQPDPLDRDSVFDMAKLAGSTEVGSTTWAQSEEKRRDCGAKRHWSSKQRAPWFNCGGNTLWYSNAKATRARAIIAKRAGFRGVAFWAPYGEDPATWRNLRRSNLFD